VDVARSRPRLWILEKPARPRGKPGFGAKAGIRPSARTTTTGAASASGTRLRLRHEHEPQGRPGCRGRAPTFRATALEVGRTYGAPPVLRGRSHRTRKGRLPVSRSNRSSASRRRRRGPVGRWRRTTRTLLYAFAACSAASQRAPRPARSPAPDGQIFERLPLGRGSTPRVRSDLGPAAVTTSCMGIAGWPEWSGARGTESRGRDGSGFEACGRDPASRPVARGQGSMYRSGSPTSRGTVSGM
jgi:hypothetical protein